MLQVSQPSHAPQLRRGDRVRQIGFIGLTLPGRTYYVRRLFSDGISVSREPGGPPLRDLKNRVLHLKCDIFWKES